MLLTLDRHGRQPSTRQDRLKLKSRHLAYELTILKVIPTITSTTMASTQRNSPLTDLCKSEVISTDE